VASNEFLQRLENEARQQSKLIEAEWLHLRRTFPQTLGPGALTAMRTCFYAGANLMFGQLDTLAKAAPMAINDRVRVMRLQDELDKFAWSAIGRLANEAQAKDTPEPPEPDAA
jgi:hypothetical protein